MRCEEKDSSCPKPRPWRCSSAAAAECWPFSATGDTPTPLSYVYSDGKIYFHCAKSGHKLDAVRECDKASFCVVARDDVVPEEFTTRYVSVIAFGRVREITGDAEKLAAMRRLAEKYAPELGEAAREAAATAACSRCFSQENFMSSSLAKTRSSFTG